MKAGPREAVEPFWQDIRTTAIERLAGRDRRFSRFLGAIVLGGRAKPSVKRVPSFHVVDGQQRLTDLPALSHICTHLHATMRSRSATETTVGNITRYVQQ